MFGIGGTEFILIIIAAIIFIGPKDLPKVLREVGKFVRKMRRMSQSVMDGFDNLAKESELDDIIQQANVVGDEMTDFRVAQQQALEARDKKSKSKPKTKTPSKSKMKQKKKQKQKPKTPSKD